MIPPDEKRELIKDLNSGLYGWSYDTGGDIVSTKPITWPEANHLARRTNAILGINLTIDNSGREIILAFDNHDDFGKLEAAGFKMPPRKGVGGMGVA